MFGSFFVDDLPTQRGGLSFLRQGDANMFPGAIIGTLSRFKDADFSTPWISSPFSILIPIPKSSTNIAALIDPMRTEVWICIGLSVPTVIASLYGLSRCIVDLNKRIN
ncbi:uncharacterized protein LOC124312514 [Daphnia pulicaria]|uniref:uncharacterized protein LOC124312514 n=1 Tax=Daphnia pulicaria TaxID=35523 RepID=UPI001EEA7F61|nr:uncharacterized protein LOC124312514 [Daphnia pulicaria]